MDRARGTKRHSTAMIADDAVLAEGVTVGPYAVIEGKVHIGSGTVIGPHVVIHSFVRIGKGNTIHAHCVLGDLPQDLAFNGEETWVEIGNNNVIREVVTITRSTRRQHPTVIGSECFIMAYSHVGHDCQVGDSVILTNCATLAGHVEIGNNTVIGGLSPIHQFVRVGPYAMVGGNTGIRKDVLPYSMISGEPARHFRLNTVGLRRAGIRGERYRHLEKAFRLLREGRRLEDIVDTPETIFLKSWLTAPSKRGLSAFAKGQSK